jgi:hypothetical protein
MPEDQRDAQHDGQLERKQDEILRTHNRDLSDSTLTDGPDPEPPTGNGEARQPPVPRHSVEEHLARQSPVPWRSPPGTYGAPSVQWGFIVDQA